MIMFVFDHPSISACQAREFSMYALSPLDGDDCSVVDPFIAWLNAFPPKPGVPVDPQYEGHCSVSKHNAPPTLQLDPAASYTFWVRFSSMHVHAAGTHFELTFIISTDTVARPPPSPPPPPSPRPSPPPPRSPPFPPPRPPLRPRRHGLRYLLEVSLRRRYLPAAAGAPAAVVIAVCAWCLVLLPLQLLLLLLLHRWSMHVGSVLRSTP